MPIYSYKNSKTNEIYDIIRKVSDRDKPYILEDGTECQRVLNYSKKNSIGVIDKNAEVFQKDADYVKKCNPKYVKFRDGHREKYDPRKHF